ncbi:MAG: glycerol acyltransferase [Flavobacteriia bacterium]|nr:glycerol acyltransferase [Flavobacteriia bacterium]
MQELKIDVRSAIREKSPKLYRRLPGFVLRYIERIVHQKEINAFMKKNGDLTNFDFSDAVVKELDLKYTFKGIEKIPKSGPVILVMNHPLGGVDGLAFISAMRDHRQDIVFLVNDILLQMAPLKSMFVGVNKHAKNTAETWEQIDKMFDSNQAVCIFPAGLVSRIEKGRVKDTVWKKTFVTYARKTGHPILPIHISGNLSKWFYGLFKFRTFFRIKSAFEMLYLADEMYKQKGKHVTFSVGTPIYVREFNTSSTDHQIAQEIKENLYKIPTHYGAHNS